MGKVVCTGLSWFNKLAPPPTIASMIGLLVGCVPALKSLMFPAVSAPLGFFTTALSTIADAFVFLISFILGAVLSKGPGPGTRSLGWNAIVTTLLNRWLFLPILGELAQAPVLPPACRWAVCLGHATHHCQHTFASLQLLLPV